MTVALLYQCKPRGLSGLSFQRTLTPPIKIPCRIIRHESGPKNRGRNAHQRLYCVGGGDYEPLDSRKDSAEAASRVALECMEYFQQGNLDAVLKYLPDSLIDKALDLKRSKFRDVLVSSQGQFQLQGSTEKNAELSLMELLELTLPSAFSFDSFAYRSLLFYPPLKTRSLSTLRVGQDRCLQRFEVTTFSGEDVTLLFDLQLEEALEPKYRSLRVVKQWFLRGITGEPASLIDPQTVRPCPEIGPEVVVTAQLDALQRRDIPGVFNFASAANRETFNSDISKFALMLESDPYFPLLGHSSSEILKSKQITAERAFIVVGKLANKCMINACNAWIL